MRGRRGRSCARPRRHRAWADSRSCDPRVDLVVRGDARARGQRGDRAAGELAAGDGRNPRAAEGRADLGGLRDRDPRRRGRGGERGRRFARPPRTAGGPARGRRGGRHRRRSFARFGRGLGDRQGDGQVGRAPGALRTHGRARVRDACDQSHRASALELSRDRSRRRTIGGTSPARAAAGRRPLRGDRAAGPKPGAVRRRGRRRRGHEPGRRRSRAVAARALRLVAALLVSRPGGAGRPGDALDRRGPGGERRRSRRRMGCSAAAFVSARARGCVPSRRCPPAFCARRSKDAPTRRTWAASWTSGRFSSTRASARRCACPIASPSRWRRTRSWPSRISAFASWTRWSRRPRGRTCSSPSRSERGYEAITPARVAGARGAHAGDGGVLARRPRRDHAPAGGRRRRRHRHRP